ncbi:MAG: hypothetical protein ABW352_00660 [Polyangiales bacterium]
MDARVFEDARVLDASPRVDAAADASACERSNVVSLDALCALLAADGRLTCPRTRADFVRSIDCSAHGFPQLRRHCNSDVLESGRADGLTYSWTFDRDSGALVHASVGGRFACGPTLYRTDRTWPSCDAQPDVDCGLCEGGAERDARCPADVVAALPHAHCEPSTISACICSPEAPKLPSPGGPCSPSCGECQDGTCWADCVCSHDGMHRWRVQCTE